METSSPEQGHHSAGAEDDHVEGLKELIAHQRHMVNNSAFGDIVFVCNDGKRVQALRMLLAGRSEVLKNLLFNGMAETRLSEIELPVISSRALLSVLEFLYTGTLLDYRPQSWTIGCELILASRFFILPILENTTRVFMLEQISDVAEDKTMAASLLTAALECGLSDDKDDFLLELVRILSIDWTNSVYVKNLSEDGLQYLLANSKGNPRDDDSLSLREYHRFMQVILWWFCKSDRGSPAKDNLANFIPVAEIRARSLYDRFRVDVRESTTEEAPSHFNDFNLCQLHDSSKNSAMRLLSNIDCKMIHPILLSEVVEPLNLISAAELLNSFRFHALKRELLRDSGPEYVWDHAASCTPTHPDLGIQSNEKKIGLAVLKRPMSLSNTEQICCFQLDFLCKDFLELGMFTYSSKVGADRLEFDGTRLSDQDHALVLTIQGTRVSVKLEGPLGQVNWKLLKTYSSIQKLEGKFVVLRYNGSQHNCSLSIGERDFGVIWKNLPMRLFYPAVSFGNSSEGMISVTLSDC